MLDVRTQRGQSAAVRAMVPDRLWSKLERAIEASLRAGTGDEGVYGVLRDLHLPAHERQLLALAYSLWRGVGPALDVRHLWGMDAATAQFVLAGLAAAVNPRDAAALLRRAADLVERQRWDGVDAAPPVLADDDDTQGFEADLLRLAGSAHAK